MDPRKRGNANKANLVSDSDSDNPRTTTTTVHRGEVEGVEFTARRTVSQPLQPLPTIDTGSGHYYNYGQQQQHHNPIHAIDPGVQLQQQGTSATGRFENFRETGYLSSLYPGNRSSERFTLKISASYLDPINGQEVKDSQELQFASKKSAETYAHDFLSRSDPELTYHVEIKDPTTSTDYKSNY